MSDLLNLIASIETVAKERLSHHFTIREVIGMVMS